jgi:kynurenine formamidase
MGIANRTPPTVEEYLAYRQRLSNWGRWGAEDQRGTLNHITSEVQRAALATVTEHRSISLAYPIDLDEGPYNAEPARREVRLAPRLNTERLEIAFHSRAFTHVDALCHFYVEHEGRLVTYNGRPASDIQPDGARSNSIDQLRAGVITRGVLYDIPRVRGTPFVTHEQPVHAWDLEDAAIAQGVEPRPGDAVLIRGGRTPFLDAHPGFPAGYAAIKSEYGGPDREPWPGCHASILEFLHEHDAALLGWDVMDARGQGYPPPRADDGTPQADSPVHEIAIPYMGLTLLDSANLEELAAACAQLGRWEFLFMLAPLVLPGGTGSPANPIAML